MAGGYQNLIVYQQAVLIFDLNEQFCRQFLDAMRDRRTIEQMQQASRSGKQNIVEGSLEKSLKMNIKLTGVARASFGELLEDYRDFLRVRNLSCWAKDDVRLGAVRRAKIADDMSKRENWPNLSGWADNPENFANLMITLISKENYLLDNMTHSLENKFVNEGGYSENLFKKRLEKKKENPNRSY